MESTSGAAESSLIAARDAAAATQETTTQEAATHGKAVQKEAAQEEVAQEEAAQKNAALMKAAQEEEKATQREATAQGQGVGQTRQKKGIPKEEGNVSKADFMATIATLDSRITRLLAMVEVIYNERLPISSGQNKRLAATPTSAMKDVAPTDSKRKATKATTGQSESTLYLTNSPPSFYLPFECAICMYELELTDTVLPCKHYFHRACIATWLNQNAACPVCRREVRYKPALTA